MELKKITIIICVVGVLAGAIFFFFRKPPVITNYPSQGETIVAFGDSLVEGVGATLGNDFSSILARSISQPIINMGISGNTSSDGLARIEGVKMQNPKVVLVLFGGNDFLRKVPIVETFKNIDKIVLELQAKGAVVVLLGVKGGLFTDEFASHFKEIAKSRGALYVPNVLDDILGNSKYMSDHIHPNDLGYKKIAEKILPALEKAL